ncbi:MAG: TonB-dependent receptor [Pseudomonadota bacterium]
MKNKKQLRFFASLTVSMVASHPVYSQSATTAEGLDEIIVVGTTPGNGLGVDVRKLPFAVQSASAAALQNSQSLDLSEFMNQQLSAVSINSAQNNPLQPDVQFRGFTASPLLGLAQGVAVYQNGVRINEPLGDAVNWDLLPESAVAGMDLISGANPLFGLNTLGGALAIRMKDGFGFTGHEAEVTTGSWGRRLGTLESGGNAGSWSYYVNLSRFQEEGWRQLSASDATNLYANLGWRQDELSALNLHLQKGDSELRGNGAAPVGLLALQRDAVFTAPDVTANDLRMVTLEGSHFLTPTLQIAGSAFRRDNNTDAFNGDASEFELSELEEMADDLSGTGIISDEAINNISTRRQESRGFDVKLIALDELFGRANQLTAGLSYFDGRTGFDSALELSELDPLTRSTWGLGTGTFLDTAATQVDTRTTTASLFFSNTHDLSAQLALTVAGRYNDSRVTLRDRSGMRPELNGRHRFQRFNPSLGLTFMLTEDDNLYGSLSESNRIPTPIELACNEGVFEVARRFAIERGDDPDDIEFECRLPNAFLADPPLDDVVTRSAEIGVRGAWADMDYRVGLYHAVNRDDILFQTTGRATGLFANVDKTRRLGFESSLNGTLEQLRWYASYSYIRATFEQDFEVLSPNHPDADADGVIAVSRGDRLPGIPEHLLKLGGDYDLAPGLSAGAELVYNSAQWLRGDESNALDTVDGFAVLNLHASYAWSQTLTVFMRVSNVFDTDYESFGLLGEDPTELLSELTDARPLFLGAGAPRAGWLGIRLRL